MSVFSNVIKPQGLEPLQFPTKFRSHSSGMAMGRRSARARTPELWIAAHELPATGGHPFYQRLNHVLDMLSFDEFVEARCVVFYATYVFSCVRARSRILIWDIPGYSWDASHLNPRAGTNLL